MRKGRLIIHLCSVASSKNNQRTKIKAYLSKVTDKLADHRTPSLKREFEEVAEPMLFFKNIPIAVNHALIIKL